MVEQTNSSERRGAKKKLTPTQHPNLTCNPETPEFEQEEIKEFKIKRKSKTCCNQQ